MKVIYKYPLAITDVQSITVPRGAEFLSVQMQHEAPQIWALVDPNAPTEAVTVRVIGTGNQVHDEALIGMKYLGTVQSGGGFLVWHVFVAID